VRINAKPIGGGDEVTLASVDPLSGAAEKRAVKRVVLAWIANDVAWALSRSNCQEMSGATLTLARSDLGPHSRSQLPTCCLPQAAPNAPLGDEHRRRHGRAGTDRNDGSACSSTGR
jgi:hypothetical protein